MHKRQALKSAVENPGRHEEEWPEIGPIMPRQHAFHSEGWASVIGHLIFSFTSPMARLLSAIAIILALGLAMWPALFLLRALKRSIWG